MKLLKKWRELQLVALTSMILTLPAAGRADEVYQWCVPIESVVSTETNAPPRAYLYIPPSCKRVRAVIVGQHNLLEETVLRNAIIRQALADNDIAAVWITPSLAGVFHYELGAGDHFNGMMKALAQESGYSELDWAPIIPIGHSAMASYPYQFATWNPERTLAAISIKGSWPDAKNPGDPPADYPRLNGVPLLYIGGEYEDANGRAAKAAAFRAKYPASPLTMLADVGGGHFDFHNRLATYMALYLKKLVQARIPANASTTGPIQLKTFDPVNTGWLYDRWRLNEAPKAAPAPVTSYAGPKNEAFWAFDEELARATNTYTQQYQNKKPQLLGYLQNGELVGQNSKLHEQVRFKAIPQADGVTYQITGTFIDSVPEGRPVWWTGQPVGSAISHATDGGPVQVEVTTGPLVRIGDDLWKIRFNRIGFNPRRGGDVWFQATQDGGNDYKRAVQQALLKIPVVNTAGTAQTLDFPPLANQTAGTSSLKLSAKASSGLPVSFYVDSGPAEIDGDTLKFLPLPPNAKWPVKVTVVAYQWGRNIEPRLKSAKPVTQVFYLTKPGQQVDPAQLEIEKQARSQMWLAVKAQAEATALKNQPPVPAIAGNTFGVNFYKNLAERPDDQAGAEVRVSNWNNLPGVTKGSPVLLDAVQDKDGNVIPNLRVTVTGGATAFNSNSYDAASDHNATSHDARMFNGAYDQSEGLPTTINVTGIPFTRYDLYLYRRDDGEGRAGSFTVGDKTLFVRGGKGTPDAEGRGYIRSQDTTEEQGTDIEQGNYVKFENLSGANLTATFTAVFAGDKVQRNKVAGFQIVERK